MRVSRFATGSSRRARSRMALMPCCFSRSCQATARRLCEPERGAEGPERAVRRRTNRGRRIDCEAFPCPKSTAPGADKSSVADFLKFALRRLVSAGPTAAALSPRDHATRILGLLSIAIGGVILSTMWLLTSDEAHHLELGSSGLGAVAFGVFLLSLRGRSFRGSSLLWPAGGVLLLMAVVNHAVTGALGPYRVMYVLVFAFIGLTQPPKTSLKLLPVAVTTYLVPELGHHDRALSVVGVIVAVPVWLLTAEVLAAGTHRLREANSSLEARNLEVQRHADFQRDFVATASHELRTPITSISGYVELLHDDPVVTEEQRGSLDVIARNAKRLEAIVQDLLTINKSDGGHLDLNLEPTRVQDLLRPVTEAYAEVCRARQIELTVGAVERAATVLVDRRQMEQVVGNLINNAAKFTPAGGRVNVTTSTSGRCVEIAIEDTGVGIPDGEVDRVFDRFFRSSRSIEMATPGTGLGLAIARDMVEAHGGKISVQSEEGTGTRFTVSLPKEGV